MNGEILTWPNILLSTKSEEVVDFVDIPDLVEYMFQIMYNNKGLGLSAVQIGELKKIFVMAVPNKQGQKIEKVVINPVIKELKGDIIKFTEGCLSFPKILIETTRYNTLVLEYLNEKCEKIIDEFNGLEAICIQHEMEHLEGKTFLRFANFTKRKFITSSLRRKQ